MSAPGHNRKSSTRANVFRFAPESRDYATPRTCGLYGLLRSKAGRDAFDIGHASRSLWVGVHVLLKVGRIDRRLDLFQRKRLGNRLGRSKHLTCEKQLPDQTTILRRHRERRRWIELVGKARHATAALAIECRLGDLGRYRQMLDEGIHADLRVLLHLLSRH